MRESIKFTQKLTGAKVDGIYGNETIDKVSNFLDEYGLTPPPDANTILAVRTNNKYSNKFDDLLILRTLDQKIIIVPCSSKAGRYYALNPLNPKGTAIIAEGFYKSSHVAEYTYRFGGRHIELKQSKGPVKFYRDNNKDRELNRVNPQTGFAGLNIHIAKEPEVNKWSAGCIVVPEQYWTELERSVFVPGKVYNLQVVYEKIKIPKRGKKQ